jgi:hypothetical protein
VIGSLVARRTVDGVAANLGLHLGAWPGTRSMSKQVSRDVQTRRPRSSLITIS